MFQNECFELCYSCFVQKKRLIAAATLDDDTNKAHTTADADATTAATNTGDSPG